MKPGIYPALITPFDSDGSVNYKMLERILDALLQRGVTGFYICGSTAETMLLSIDERKKILETVMGYLQGSCQVFAHIGAQYTEDSIALAKHAASLGVNGISSLPPIYFKYTPQELTNYFLEIADATELPLIVYNAPALAGVEFNKGNLKGILEHPNIAGIKFTSYDLFNLQQVQAAYPDKIMINGHDELFLNTLPMGLKHAIGSTFNFMPEKFIAIRNAFDLGDLETARKIQSEANEIIAGLIQIGVFRGVKAMMELLGMPVGACRRPFAPIRDEEWDLLRPLADRCQKF